MSCGRLCESECRKHGGHCGPSWRIPEVQTNGGSSGVSSPVFECLQSSWKDQASRRNELKSSDSYLQAITRLCTAADTAAAAAAGPQHISLKCPKITVVCAAVGAAGSAALMRRRRRRSASQSMASLHYNTACRRQAQRDSTRSHNISETRPRRTASLCWRPPWCRYRWSNRRRGTGGGSDSSSWDGD